MREKFPTSCYCVDIDVKTPEVEQMMKKKFTKTLKINGTGNLFDLASHDWHLFEHFLDAKTFLEAFTEMKDKLGLMNLKCDYSIPKILLKRKYLITTLMGVKRFTTRHYDKKWSPGQLFQLYDCTYFLTVKLKSITEVTFDNTPYYRYDFELI